MEGKVVIIENKKFIWYKGDLHTHKGFIKEGELKDIGKTKTHKGKEAYIFPITIPDYIESIERGPAIVHPKDFGIIVGITGINKDSIVIEAGTGSGATAIMFGNIVKKVITYEKREDFLEIAKRNIERSGLKNITIKKGDIYKEIKEEKADLFFLDLKEPWKAIETCKSSLKKGGFLVIYAPHINQIQETVKNATKEGFFHITTIQPSLIEWIVEEKRLRPRHLQKIHTGFLSFLRRWQ